MGMPMRREREPEPLGYTVVRMINGAGVIPPGTDELDTLEEAIAVQRTLAEDESHRGPWVACKVVPLDDEQEQS
jgi:hypothetical protein